MRVGRVDAGQRVGERVGAAPFSHRPGVVAAGGEQGGVVPDGLREAMVGAERSVDRDPAAALVLTGLVRDAARRTGALDAEQIVVLGRQKATPQSDSSMACAMVTDAGTPYRCSAAIAPGATAPMNACWELVCDAVAADAAGSAGARSASSRACSADRRPAGKLAGTPAGLVSAAVGPGAMVMPVTTPLADTVTRAVAFSHGFAPPTAEETPGRMSASGTTPSWSVARPAEGP